MEVIFKPEFYLSPELSPTPEFTEDMEAWFFYNLKEKHDNIKEFHKYKDIKTLDVKINCAYKDFYILHFYVSVNGEEYFHYGEYDTQDNSNFLKEKIEWFGYFDINECLEKFSRLNKVNLNDPELLNRKKLREEKRELIEKKKELLRTFKLFHNQYRNYLKLKRKFTKKYFGIK